MTLGLPCHSIAAPDWIGPSSSTGRRSAVRPGTTSLLGHFVLSDQDQRDRPTSLEVTVTPTGTAKATTTYAPATFDFPITGGHVKVYNKGEVTPYVQGIIHHDRSGRQFAAGGKTLTVENFDIDPGTSMLMASVKGMSGKIPLFFSTAATCRSPRTARATPSWTAPRPS